MPTLADLVYEHVVVRSDGAKFIDGVRNDSANTSWLTVDGGRIALGPGLYDEMLAVPYVATDDEVRSWHEWNRPMFDVEEYGRTVTRVDEQGMDIAAVTHTASELSQTVARVEDDVVIAQSTIQQQAQQIALRVQAVDEAGNPIGMAQIVVAHVDGQGRIYLGADTIVDGTLLLHGSMKVETEDGAIVVGPVGDKPWGSSNLPAGTMGIWGEQAGLYLRGYARLLDAGFEQDEGVIDLSGFGPLGDVEVLVAPKEMVTYSPERDTLSHMYVDAIKQPNGNYVVKAKVMVKGQEHIWGGRGNTRDYWEYIRPTGSVDSKKGVYTDFIICRPTWWISGAGAGLYPVNLWLDVTNQFNANGDPINWVNKRSWSRSAAGSGTLNWDTALDFGQWAVRVRGQGGGAVLVSYAETGLQTLGYRSGDTYLDVDGNVIGGSDPASTPSRMSVLYMVLDRG